ncbi:metallophosphoesterase family protein [Pontiella sulfatireligans]|uniref:metallophosphoesterase family protein n=1 Tax=Pontiella sulfatireligans TaxID=2750658 RepID=UPI001443D669|nr:YfcE family phosphodiesterase [Pontiella sulfatireligans]
MKVGILSDTHGNLPVVEKAARMQERAGVGAVFHCGDIGGSDVLAELAGVFHPLGVPVYAVLGNVDAYSSDWKFFPSNIGIHLLGRFGEVEVAGKQIALLHSDDSRRFSQAVHSGEYDFVFSGHSHEVHDYMVGKTRCINPGTAGRGAPNTCAVLDLESGELSVYEM